MAEKKFKYVGPTGGNPELGYVEHGSEITVPEELQEKYLDRKLIEDLPTGSKLKRNTKKEE